MTTTATDATSGMDGSGGVQSPDARPGGGNSLAETLSAARFEMLPLRGAAERAMILPAGTTVTVTASVRKGIGATLDLAETLSGYGLHVVPHLSARLIEDWPHLSDVLDRVDAIGSGEVFVVAGDTPVPRGDFPDALSLLHAMADHGRLPRRVGITGYPERHTLISDGATIHAMSEKSRYAHYIVSQICYEPYTIAAWVKAVRARGVTAPVYVGIPGVVDIAKLLRISLRIGLGDSLRFLRKQHGVVPKMLTNYAPDDLVDGLAGYLDDPCFGIAGWHFFTFNEVARTSAWRNELLESKGQSA